MWARDSAGACATRSDGLEWCCDDVVGQMAHLDEKDRAKLAEWQTELAEVKKDIITVKGGMERLQKALEKEQKTEPEIAAALAPDKANLAELRKKENGSLSLALLTCVVRRRSQPSRGGVGVRRAS